MPITSEISVKPQAFASAVAWVAKWVTAKPVVPVQGGMSLSYDSGEWTLGAYGENVTARAVLPGEVINGGGTHRAIVSGRLLAELAGTFDGKKPIVISGEGGAVVLTAGRFVATLPTLPEDDWPTLPDSLPAIGSIQGDAFADAVRRVAVTVDSGSAEVKLTAMYLGFTGDVLAVVGGSRPRAATVRPAWIPNRFDSAQPYATPTAAVLTDAAAAFAGPDAVEIGCDGRVLSLTSPVRSLTMRLLDLHDLADGGQLMYPIDQLTMAFGTEQERVVTIDRGELVTPVKRAAIMRGPKGPVRVTFAEGTLTIGAVEGETKRHSDDMIEIDCTGETVTVGVDPDYLSDALKTAPGDEITIRFSEPSKRLVLTCDADPTWRHVLMPMRIS